MKLSKIGLLLILLGSCTAIQSLEREQTVIQEKLEIVTQEIEDLTEKNAELRNMIEIFIEENASEPDPVDVYLPVCSKGTWKSWMSYLAITSPSSKQYALQKEATTDLKTGFRMVDNFVMVAMGPQYGPVGRKLQLYFEDGQTLFVIVGDIKHQGCTSSDGSMLEFIVDKKLMLNSVRVSGNYNDIYKGQIVAITAVPKT